jgi:hypothetical protein
MQKRVNDFLTTCYLFISSRTLSKSSILLKLRVIRAYRSLSDNLLKLTTWCSAQGRIPCALCRIGRTDRGRTPKTLKFQKRKLKPTK